MEKEEFSVFLKKVRKFEKEVAVVHGRAVRIAVLGSFSVQYFVKILKYLLYKNGIKADIYEGQYDGIAMDALDEKSALYSFQPECVIILPYYEDVRNLPPLLSDEMLISKYLRDECEYYLRIWEGIHERCGAQILMSNIVTPSIRSMGNLEYMTDSSKCGYICRINEMVVKNSPPYVTVVDADALSSNIGKYSWFDYRSYFLNKSGMKLEYLPEFVALFVNQILALNGNIRKCLVLDLDNTLWGGTVGDDGVDGIMLDPNNAIGEAFRFFQKYVLELKNRGVILAVCSKNEEGTAKGPFVKNPNMLLKLSDFACFVADWNDKASNLKRIAGELNIGTESLVFFDDSPAERDIVRRFLPEVHVVDVPLDPALYALQLERESPFEWEQITKEDLLRTDSYNENRQRNRLRESCGDYDSYLKALGMKGCVRKLSEEKVSRFVQLINKSNQFNMRTVRYSEGEIRAMMEKPDISCLYAELSDKYSVYGLISCVILKKIGIDCFIDTWVMSCRVLKRGVENMMLEAIFSEAVRMGCLSVTAEYIRTKKNNLMGKLLDEKGFDLEQTILKGDNFRKTYRCAELDRKYPYFIGQ